MPKCYNIMITGKVQDIGFRTLIEDAARLYNLQGYSFNDVDGSVKIVCCGENGIIFDFLEELKFKGDRLGASIDEIRKEEIPFQIYLPQKFVRIYTDELADISRKLDKGIEILRDIKADTASLPEIKTGLDNLNAKFDSFIVEQKEHNQWMKEHIARMDEHNLRLEKILEKLAGM